MTPGIKSPEEELRLQHWLLARNEPPYRLRQVREWLYRRYAVSFDEMSNVPKALHGELSESWRAFSLTPEEEVRAPDGTRKILFHLADGPSIESVLIQSGTRTTACISTQAGCPVGCTFCATGRAGFVRDLDTAEIVDQALFLCRLLEDRVRNVVVMGMGEPLLNLKHLAPALDLLCDPDHLGIGDRHITISTSGIVPGIIELAHLGRQWNLAVSLHAATDALRRRLIPSRFRYPVDDIAEACRVYRTEAKRMVTFEYVLLAGVNDGADACRDLSLLARRVGAKVNLIPYNDVEGVFRRPDEKQVLSVATALRSAGVAVTVRQSRGTTIQGACGQLRRLFSDSRDRGGNGYDTSQERRRDDA